MKTSRFKMDWLIPVLGIAVVAGWLVAATTYCKLERQADAEEALVPTIERLSHDLTLSVVLKTLRDGEVDKAAQRLDLLLCWDILRTDSELASADARIQACGEDVFRRIALVRPKTAERPAAGSTQESGGALAAAQQILERALTRDQIAQTR